MAKSQEIITPAEKRRFLAAARTALRDLDYQQFRSLVYWQGANERACEVFEDGLKNLFEALKGRPGLKVAFRENDGLPLTAFGGNTLKPTHVLEITAKTMGVIYPVGIKDGRLHISWPRRQTPKVELDDETKKRIDTILQAAKECDS